MVMNLENIKKELKNVLQVKRYEHVIRVCDTAVRLNKDLSLGLDDKKIKLAALLHDCAKNNEEKYFNFYREKYNLKENIFEDFFIAHAILGEIVAKELYGVEDDEVLSAIRWHTTGTINMNLLEKLIFISDFIEPGRDFKDSKIVETKIYENFDKGILLCLNLTIKHLIDKNVIINLETIKARNYLQRRINE